MVKVKGGQGLRAYASLQHGSHPPISYSALEGCGLSPRW